MSHFAVLVFGDDIENQLSKYDENIEVEEYAIDITEKSKECFLKIYQDNNSNLTFDELYVKYGKEYNNNKWKKDEKGEWKEYTTYNPNSKWDWWCVGGRWSGSFIKHVFNASHESVEKGRNSNFDASEKWNIDIEHIKKEAYDDAYKMYKNVEKLFGGSIPHLEKTWRELVEENKGKDIDTIKEKYHKQEAQERLNEILNKYKRNTEECFEGTDISIYRYMFWHFTFENYDCTAEEYAQKASSNALVPFAVVKGGEWFERGNMGWFGVASNEKNKDEWANFVNKLIDEATPNTLFTYIDCHI